MTVSPVRVAAALVVAAACAVTLAAQTYLRFERVRLTVSRERSPSPANLAVVGLPDLSRLADVPAVLLIDLRNDSTAPTTATVAVDERRVAEWVVPPSRRVRFSATVPHDLDLKRATTLSVRADAGGWSIERAELSNARGFSSGLLQLVVVPYTVTVYERPPAMAGAVLFSLLLLAGLSMRSWPVGRRGVTLGVVAAAAGCMLAAVWLAPYFSPYRILLSVHTLLVIVGLLYLPAVAEVADPAVRPMAIAVRRTASAAVASLRGRPPGPALTTQTLTLSYLFFLILLAMTSRPRIVGDGRDYVAMALEFAAGRWPSVDVSSHFWLYSAVASPLVAVTNALGLGPPLGFLLFNAALLVAAFTIVAQRLDKGAVLLLFAGPIVWWVDKAHTEIFTFSLLTIAIAWLLEKPWWSLIALGAAAAQNPPVGFLIPLAALASIAGKPAIVWDRRMWLALASSTALSLLQPIYFLSRVGRAVPLLDPGKPSWPSAGEAFAVLTDANIGLLPHMPALAVGMAIAAWCQRRRWPPVGDRVFAAAATGVFLFSFAQTGNFNHGGTRDMSRYALWLMPLTIPFFRAVPWEQHARARRVLHVVAAVSAIWSVVTFHPGRAERYVQPTWLAQQLWTHLPSATDPLPEIFAERLQHVDGTWTLPVATASCDKALLRGQGGTSVIWPPQCPHAPVPDVCARPGAVCYANRTAAGYVFKSVKSNVK